MATFTKKLLSGSTNGKQIKIVHTTNGTADTIHTCAAGTAFLDELWLYVYNDDTVSRTLNLLWGGVVEPDNVIRIQVASKASRLLVVDGMLLQNGLSVQAYADAANVLVVDGFANNIA